MAPVGEGKPGQGIEADLGQLGRLAARLDEYLDGVFEPRAASVLKVYGTGADFGLPNPGGAVSGARARHGGCLQAAADQLVSFANATRLLAQAARTVEARYRGVDALAAASSAEVERELRASMQVLRSQLSDRGVE